jgi:2-hydroxyglutaryl-CoA dehydratase, D-component
MNGPEPFSQNVARLRQDPQHAARQAAATGQRVVGYVGNDVPVALILASGALPVRLRGEPDADSSRADEFVESSFAPQVRAIAAQWLRGALDHLHSVVFARSDDSGQRLYYYLCELQRRGLCAGPRPLLYDAASLARDTSFEHTLESTRLLAAQLDAAALALVPAIERVKQREELLAAVQARRLLPAPLPGSAAWECVSAAACDWRTSFDEAARRWLDAATLLAMPKRVILAGDPPPDAQLHTAIEAAGASVVLELTESTQRTERNHRQPLAAIAADFHARESPALSMRRDARWLADQALDHRADAVLVWLSEENEALPWEIARQMQALRAAGIPALSLARQSWQIPAAVLAQIMHFVRSPGEFR